VEKSARKARAILDVIALIQIDLARQDADTFASDAPAQELLAFRLLRIGEYARDISLAERETHSEIE